MGENATPATLRDPVWLRQRGGNQSGIDADSKQCILFRKITPRQSRVPERACGQIRRKVWRGAKKLDAGTQILTGVKANLDGRVDGETREIARKRPNRRSA